MNNNFKERKIICVLKKKNIILNESIFSLEELEIFNESKRMVIDSPLSIDNNNSSNSIKTVRERVKRMLDSGNYRDFKSSDKNLLVRALKSKEFFTTIWGAGGGITKLLSQVRYSVFKYEGLTLYSVYFPSNTTQKTGLSGSRQKVFAVVVKDNGDEVKNKVVMKVITLRPNKQNVRDKIDM